MEKENKINYLNLNNDDKIKVLEYLSKTGRLGFLCELKSFVIKLEQIEKIFNFKIGYNNNLKEDVIDKLIQTGLIKEEDETNLQKINEYVSQIKIKEIVGIQEFVYQNENLNTTFFINFLKKLMLAYNSILAFDIHKENKRFLLEKKFNLFYGPFSKEYNALKGVMAGDGYGIEINRVFLYDLLKDYISFRDLGKDDVKGGMTKSQLELFKIKTSLEKESFKNSLGKIDTKNLDIFIINSYIDRFENNQNLFLGDYGIADVFKILVKSFSHFFVFKNYGLTKIGHQSNNRQSEYIDYNPLIEKEEKEINYISFISYKWSKKDQLEVFIDLEILNQNYCDGCKKILIGNERVCEDCYQKEIQEANGGPVVENWVA